MYKFYLIKNAQFEIVDCGFLKSRLRPWHYFVFFRAALNLWAASTAGAAEEVCRDYLEHPRHLFLRDLFAVVPFEGYIPHTGMGILVVYSPLFEIIWRTQNIMGKYFLKCWNKGNFTPEYRQIRIWPTPSPPHLILSWQIARTHQNWTNRPCFQC